MTIDQLCDTLTKSGNHMMEFHCKQHFNAPVTAFLDARRCLLIVSCTKCEKPIAYAWLFCVPALAT